MLKISKVSLLAVLIVAPLFLFAQFNNNTTSPYSRYGLGDLQPNSFGRSSAMGGALLGSRNKQQINYANPASYTSADSLSFLFEFGLSGKLSTYKSNLSSFQTNDANFNYFVMAFRINKWAASSFGLTPFSDSGYDVQVFDEVDPEGIVWQRYHGEGSLSKAYLGFGFEPVKNISIGTNFYYLFGSLSKNADLAFIESSDSYSDQRSERIRLRDFGLNLGLQATIPLKDDQSLTIGATLENKPKFTAFHSDLATKGLSVGNNTDIDTFRNIVNSEGIIELPRSYGLGVSYLIKDKFELNADYYNQAWSKAKFFGATNQFVTDLKRFALGAEWIPEQFSIRSYLKRISYRAGLKYEKSYLIIGDNQINDFGISFGVGLPVTDAMRRTKSTINLAAELGKRGTVSNNLIREQYVKLSLSVNIQDIWFVKRKFD